MSSEYQLYIANKNYSSWSLRPWVLMRELRIPFTEHLVRFGGTAAEWEAYRRISPTGKVPCLVDGTLTVWDSLSIAEYLAERHEGVWPTDAGARAWARSASAEMHSGFTELRNRCSMSCGVRVRLKEFPPSLERDLARLNGLWSEGLHRFGGPYLSGATFTAVGCVLRPGRVQSPELRPDAVAGVRRVCGADTAPPRDAGVVYGRVERDVPGPAA